MSSCISCVFVGCCGCGWTIFGGSLKFGAFDLGTSRVAVSATPNDMISTILETSLLIFSGNVLGTSFPVSLRLHRYIDNANSGNSSWPDFVVSESVHICAKLLPSSLLLSRRSFAFSPLNACSPPVALLNSCSNFAWSCAVMKLSRTLGIFAPPDFGTDDEDVAGAGAGDGRKELAMSVLVIPVFCGT